MLTKTFFIDWERPQPVVTSDVTKPPSADLTKGVTTAPTVIWRTYLVANEWNELQNYRKTSIAVQMITMAVLLKWLQLENWAAVAPGFSTEHRSPPFSESRLSRFALNSFLYLTIAAVQWVFHVLIIERILVDPFHSMIDLCSIANISVLSLTHPLYGYYIHGRSVHGRADTDMAHMNQYLQNERDNLCGNRGLEPGSDLQTFIVCLPKAFRDQFDEIAAKVFIPTTQTVRLTGTEATTAKVQKIAKVHDEINQFLMEFIDHSNTTADYVLRDRSFLESVLDIDFKDTTQTGNFARDNSEMAFSGAFVYGNEWSYLSFELLLFSCIDLATTNSAFAAFITFTFSTLFRKSCSVFFTNSLTKSSFVDQRFLF
uniref:Meckelin n=1 Tax=Ascaris suum TaxID=6253 RepID=F1L820_ASCSU